MDQADLRQHLRHLRNQLTDEQQLTAAQDIVNNVKESLGENSKVACYLANDGEISASLIINHCWHNNIDVALPVLHTFNRGYLNFQSYLSNTAMTANKYQILEPAPDASAIVPLNHLNVIMMPLVGFDHLGNRLGMGGGYYDRTLAQNIDNKPILIGLAHDCQEVSQLPTNHWDIPVDIIVTPSQKIVINNRN